MRRWLGKFFTSREQKALLFVCGFALLGLALNQFAPDALQAADTPSTQVELSDSLKADQPIQIDIRTASKEELMLLPGIGEKRAQDILDYRAKTPFTSVAELINVSGIGPKTLNKLLPSLLSFGDSLLLADVLGNLSLDKGSGLLTPGISSLVESPAKPASRKRSGSSSTPKSQLTNIVNLNSADVAELCTLPGIGEVKAKAVIAYRQENGPFASVDEITKVKGIGPKTLAKIRNRLSI